MKRTARKSTQSNKPLEEDISKLSIKNEDSNSMTEFPEVKLEETNPPEKHTSGRNQSVKTEKSTVPVKTQKKVAVKAEKKIAGKAEEKVVVKLEKGVVEAEVKGAVGGVNGRTKISSILSKYPTKDQKTDLSKPGPIPHFQKRKIVSEPVLDDCKGEIDYSPVVEKVEPAGILYDDKGIHIASGLDLCDCGTKDCCGCWYPCPKCSSNKCGLHCRVHRKFMYEEVIVEGHGYVYRNELYKDLRT